MPSLTILHSDIKMKYCAHGHSVATQLNPHGVTTVAHKYSLTVTTHNCGSGCSFYSTLYL